MTENVISIDFRGKYPVFDWACYACGNAAHVKLEIKTEKTIVQLLIDLDDFDNFVAGFTKKPEELEWPRS